MVIINKILPIGKRYFAINLCGVIFAKGPCDKVTLNHEAIHTAQMKELLFVGFYIWYIMEWLYQSFRKRGFHRGYMSVSFEREAYANDTNLKYLASRKPFAFLRLRE